jgi:hypothetical protein
MVQAMFVEQLNTRRSILSATDSSQPRCRQPQRIILSSNKVDHEDSPTITLGAILQRETAARQAAHLKAAMDATSSRIVSLEKELSVMKKLLNESETQRISIMESARSASFHYGSQNKIERGERGSASSVSLRFCVRGERVGEGSSSSLETPRTRKNMRRRLMDGLKTAFRASKNRFESSKSSRVDEDEYAEVTFT